MYILNTNKFNLRIAYAKQTGLSSPHLGSRFLGQIWCSAANITGVLPDFGAERGIARGSGSEIDLIPK
jgi:hypothetical protein